MSPKEDAGSSTDSMPTTLVHSNESAHSRRGKHPSKGDLKERRLSRSAASSFSTESTVETRMSDESPGSRLSPHPDHQRQQRLSGREATQPNGNGSSNESYSRSQCCQRCQQLQSENSTLRSQLSQSRGVIQLQNSACQTLEAEVAHLHEVTEDLNGENDHLVNDMQDLLVDHEELKVQLEESNASVDALQRGYDLVVAERDRLDEKLETASTCFSRRASNDGSSSVGGGGGDSTLDADEVAEVVSQIRTQMKRRLRAFAEERSILEEKVRDLSWQRDELNQTVETLATEKSGVAKKMEELIEVVQDLQASTGRLSMEKAELERRLKEREKKQQEGGRNLVVTEEQATTEQTSDSTSTREGNRNPSALLKTRCRTVSNAVSSSLMGIGHAFDSSAQHKQADASDDDCSSVFSFISSRKPRGGPKQQQQQQQQQRSQPASDDDDSSSDSTGCVGTGSNWRGGRIIKASAGRLLPSYCSSLARLQVGFGSQLSCRSLVHHGDDHHNDQVASTKEGENTQVVKCVRETGELDAIGNGNGITGGSAVTEDCQKGVHVDNQWNRFALSKCSTAL